MSVENRQTNKMAREGKEAETHKNLPIIEDADSYGMNEEPEFPDGKIVHFKMQFGPEEKHLRNRFILHQKIAGLHYRFYLSEGDVGGYTLLFKTKEYEYATTNLDAKSKETLESTIVSFINSTNKHPDARLKYVLVQPADASFSKEEIEACLAEVLKSPDNERSEEELRSEYKSFRIFDLYEDLYYKNFNETHYNHKSRARARSRYFKSMFRKLMPDWIISTAYGSSTDFLLKPKAEEQ